MAVTGDHFDHPDDTCRTYQTYHSGPHPIHAVLLAGTIPLFLGALLSDIGYWFNYEIQWSNFASWLIAGGLVFAGLALLCAIIGLFRADNRNRNSLVYILVLLLTWALGFLNALYHARDAWAVMPAGLILSVIVFLLALSATTIAFLGYTEGGVR